MSEEKTLSFEEFKSGVGTEVGVSRWFSVSQEKINTFADVTEDQQFIHIDPKRAAAETPFGGTIAHGFLTVSLMSAMAYDAQPKIAGVEMLVNYGFERLRFISPVPSGSRVRGRFVLASVEERKPGEITIKWNVTVEIEGSEKPAIVAEWIGRQYMGNTA